MCVSDVKICSNGQRWSCISVYLILAKTKREVNGLFVSQPSRKLFSFSNIFHSYLIPDFFCTTLGCARRHFIIPVQTFFGLLKELSGFCLPQEIFWCFSLLLRRYTLIILSLALIYKTALSIRVCTERFMMRIQRGQSTAIFCFGNGGSNFS